MEKNKKILIGVSVALLAASIGVYFYTKSKKNTKEEPPVKEEEKPIEQTKSANTQAVSKPKETKTASVIPYGRKLYSTGDNVNIRLQPSTSGKVMARVNKGQEIGINAGESNGAYIGIIHKNSKGEIWWVAKQYVKA